MAAERDSTSASGPSTQIIAASQVRRLAIARHRAEAVAARIGVDCDRMLRTVSPARRQWRDGIGDALLASRTIVTQAQGSVATEDTAAAQLAELEEVTRDSLQRVADAMSQLLRAVPTSVEDELLVGDARAIHALAITTQSAAAIDLAEPAAGSPLAGAAQAPPGGDDRRLGTAAMVLIVDDDPGMRRALAKLLHRLGYDVTEAENGRAALDSALAMPVDLVITDMDMPEMNGMGLLRELKASPGLNHLPVIVVSSDSDMSRITKTIEMGAEDFIPKPFDATLLQARVRASLGRKRLRDLELDHLKRVSQVAAAAEAVDRNVYVPGSLAAVADGRDELAHLARVFERMVLNIRSREERLAQRVRLLRREVGGVSSTASIATTVSPESPFGSGDVVGGRYEIVGQIGSGGMGTVYHATDRELRVDVAIKVVRADLIQKDPTLVDRLKSETRLARQLSHPNILRAHDLGEWNGVLFLSMEYVRGVSVSALLDQRGRLSVDAVIAIGIQLADALAIAHAQRIIHRDVKPSNLIMDESGVLKVMDFGLAKSLAPSTERGTTQSGMVIGTPEYMAPEQLTGGTLDERSDLYAVGIVLYECLSGRTPFDADSPGVMLTQMVGGTYPALMNTVPDVPPSLEAVIAKLLQLRPDNRIQTAAELSRLLTELEPLTTI